MKKKGTAQWIEIEFDKRFRQYLEDGKELKPEDFDIKMNLEDYVWIEMISEKQNISKDRLMLEAIREKIIKERHYLTFKQ